MAQPLEPKLVLSVPRRRLRIGDLMVAVALVALGISTVTVVELTSDKGDHGHVHGHLFRTARRSSAESQASPAVGFAPQST